jgi:hypothetical protein
VVKYCKTLGESPEGSPTGRCGRGEISCLAGWDHSLTRLTFMSRSGAGASAVKRANSSIGALKGMEGG